MNKTEYADYIEMADDIYSDDYINQASVALIEEQDQEPEFDEANAIFL